MRVTLSWDSTIPQPDNPDPSDPPCYRIEWSADGNAPWTSLVNYTNQNGTFDCWSIYYGPKYNDDTIAPGTTRYYRALATNLKGGGGVIGFPSNVVSVTTPGLVDSGFQRIGFGAVESELDALNDQKVFRIQLETGEYRFRISGDAPKHRVIVTDPGGTEIEKLVLESSDGLSPRITAQSAGQHQVKISHGGGFGNAGGGSLNAGSFYFQLVPVSDPAAGTLGPSDASVTLILNSYADVDRAELAVRPGEAYAVRVGGRERNNEGTAATPWIKRTNPPGTYTDHHMGKPWVTRVTTTETSNSNCVGLGQSNKCEEFQAFVIDLRGLTGAQQTWQISIAPDGAPRHAAVPCGHLPG